VPAPARAACAPFPPSRPRLAWQCMNLKHRIQSNNSSGVPRHVSVSGRTQDRGAFPSDTWLRGAFATPHPPEPAPRPYCTARALARVCCSLAGLCGDGKDSGRGSSQISPSLRRTTTRAPFRCSPSAFSRPAPASLARHLRLYPRAAPAPLMKVAWRRRSRATAERHGWCCCRWRATGTRQRSRCRPALLLPGSAPGQAVRKGAPLSMLLRARCFTCSLKCSRGCARTYRPR
jgi:hypothetical protein